MPRHIAARRPLLLLALAPLGCGDATGPGVPERMELSRAERRWSSAGLRSYDYDYTHHCFCPEIGVVRVSVRDGRVTAATQLAPAVGPFAHPTPRPEAFQTMERVFAQAERAIERGDDGYSATFHPSLGHVTALTTGDSDAIDSGFSLTISNLRPAP